MMAAARNTKFLLGILLALSIGRPVEAAGLSTRLEGIVVDVATGLPLEGAAVALAAGEYATRTDAAGRFSFAYLPSGEWGLHVSRIGYRPHREVRVIVTEDFIRTIRIGLTPQPIELAGQRVRGIRPSRENFAQAGEIITAREIKKAGYRSVAAALASLPGVIVNEGYSSSGASQVSIRGESGKQLAVTVDGVSLADGVRGEVDLSVVPLAAVESITVIRGGGWGDAALGGSIRIVTRSLLPVEQTIGAGYGSFDNLRLASTISRSLSKTCGVLLSGDISDRGEQYRYVDRSGNDSTRANTGRLTEKIFAKLGCRPGENWEWGMSALYHANNRGAPGALHTSTPYAELRERRRMLTTELTGSPVGWLKLTLRGSAGDFRTNYHDSVTFKSHTQFDETTYLVNAQARLVPDDNSIFNATVGGELQHRVLDGNNYLVKSRSFGRVSRTANAVWLQVQLHSPTRFPNLWGGGKLSGGIRYDRDGQTPDYWAPRVGMAWGWGLPHFVVVSANWGRSFRRPLLTSLFWKEDAFSSGNPELEPEKSREWDIGIELSPPRPNLQFTSRWFDRAVDGYIEWEKRYGGVWAPINVPRATIVGREDGLGWSSTNDHFGADFFHTLMWATNQADDRNYNGKYLLFRPKHTYQAKFHAEYHGVRAQIDGRWVSRRYIRKQNTKPLPPYRLFSASLRKLVTLA